jgi:hypothetical protein
MWTPEAVEHCSKSSITKYDQEKIIEAGEEDANSKVKTI